VAYYFDTSAVAKLLLRESETPAFTAFWRAQGMVPCSSEILWTELLRAIRSEGPELAVTARALLHTMSLLRPSREIFDQAARLDPSILRTLDAIHLATALALGASLDAVVTYDARMAESAHALGIPVLAPR
jgi:predicted nucleic acid-binding protein